MSEQKTIAPFLDDLAKAEIKHKDTLHHAASVLAAYKTMVDAQLQRILESGDADLMMASEPVHAAALRLFNAVVSDDGMFTSFAYLLRFHTQLAPEVEAT